MKPAFLALATSLCLAAPALAQEALPPGPGHDTVNAVCTGCHQVNMITRSSGYTREGCLKFIASALIGELFGALKGQAKYDEKRYVANLKALPKLPWEKDEAEG